MKNYVKNESGSTLVTVVLFCVILITVCLGILSATIESGRRTTARINDIQTQHKSVASMDKVIETFKGKVSLISPTLLETDNLSNSEYQKKIDIIIEELKNDETLGDVKIVDVTKKISGIADNETYKISNHTRSYEITLKETKNSTNGLPESKKKVTATVLLSPTPSFFQFVAGSEKSLNLHGGSEFVGDVFSDKNVYLSKNVTYYHENNEKSTRSTLPSIAGDLYFNDTIEIDEIDSDSNQKATGNTYSLSNLDAFYKDNYTSKKFMGKDLNDKIIPNLKRNKHEFIDMNFDKSFLEVWNKAFGIKIGKVDFTIPENYEKKYTSNVFVDQTLSKITTKSKDELLQAILDDTFITNKINDKSLLIIDQKTNLFSIKNGKYKDKDLKDFDTILFTNISEPINSTTERIPFTLPSTLQLDTTDWVIIDGDLSMTADEAANTANTLTGNLLVTGNIYITGDETIDSNSEEDVDFQFNSTIYSLGTCEIKSTDISSLDENNPLVMMCKDNLLITRINEFKDVTIDTNTNNILDGLFYTENEATLYGVGSNFYIYGGIFAKEKLTVQAVRQEKVSSTSIDNLSLTIENQLNEPSRFLAVYNPSILTTRLDTLPTVNKLQFIVTSYIVE